jgi:hypothetical protein
MAPTEQERTTIEEDETARWSIRRELKRRRRPWLLTVAALWMLLLTILALSSIVSRN